MIVNGMEEANNALWPDSLYESRDAFLFIERAQFCAIFILRSSACASELLFFFRHGKDVKIEPVSKVPFVVWHILGR